MVFKAVKNMAKLTSSSGGNNKSADIFKNTFLP